HGRCAHRLPPSLPTRRSSDLGGLLPGIANVLVSRDRRALRRLAIRRRQAELIAFDGERPRHLRAARCGAAERAVGIEMIDGLRADRKSTRLNSSHVKISYAVF